SPERRIGLAAHDFAQLAAAPEVVLTRAGRAAGKPTKPSRWIVRLKNILKGANLLKGVEETETACALAAHLDRPETITSISAPQPRPPVAARPKSLSVTQVEKLLRDPYSIYAQKILALRKLDPLGEEFGNRHLGNLFHKVLEDYADETPPASREARVERLAALYANHAEAFGLDARHAAFWRARAEEAFAFLADWDAARRTQGAPAIIEEKGQTKIDVGGEAYELTAKADRIDRLENGAAFIVDYKTGAPPSLKQEKAFSPHLPLTGMIVEAGGFDALGPAPVAGFEYVRVVSRKPDEKFAGADGADAAQQITEARDGLVKLFAHFANEDAAY
ncbi:MAG: PD-(D/E)XK nuclease family protein, partial [Oricola sp.]|nr:PD-(D/E)XK nuclease family protein [Oricola sp.]